MRERWRAHPAWRAEFEKVIGKLDLDDPYECKRALSKLFPAIVAKYGGMAAAAAAEHFASEREAVLGNYSEPLVADPVPEEAMLAKLRYELRYLFEEDSDGERGE